MKVQGQKGKCKDDIKSYSLDCFEQVERSKITYNFWTKFDNSVHCGPCFTLANQGLIHLTGSSDLDRVLTKFGKFTDSLAKLGHLISFRCTDNTIIFLNLARFYAIPVSLVKNHVGLLHMCVQSNTISSTQRTSICCHWRFKSFINMPKTCS